ncbi:hypothetical protein HHI36_017893 [Cryptolaemus montrouzieri]|uniref:Insulin-like domain-containing protein n=1 Tax=Cryptolaemus montrouzieri TaxID=559131 RepID=A0ABD2NNX7_9CUCU
MEEEKFCGSKLVHAMSMMCASYYSPDDIAMSSVKRKGIIEICCTRPCSLYVLSHYCKTLRKEYVEMFLELGNARFYSGDK